MIDIMTMFRKKLFPTYQFWRHNILYLTWYLIFLAFWSHSVLLRIGQYTKSRSRISQTHSSRGLLSKYFLKICSKFTGEHPWRSVISIKLLCNFIKIKLRHGCSPVNLLHIFRAPFSKNNSRGLLLISPVCISQKVNVVILAISIWLLIYNFSNINLIINLWKCNKKKEQDRQLSCPQIQKSAVAQKVVRKCERSMRSRSSSRNFFDFNCLHFVDLIINLWECQSKIKKQGGWLSCLDR